MLFCVVSVQDARRAEAKKQAQKEEALLGTVPICSDPARMQPILATLSQIQSDAVEELKNERSERSKKLQRVRLAIATTRFLSRESRKKSVAQMKKTFKKRKPRHF